MNDETVSDQLPSADQSIFLSAADISRWDEYVIRNHSASIYHLSLWREIIKDVFGHRSYYIYTQASTGEITGVLPLIRLTSHLFGDYMVSVPYFNYGGVVGDSPSIQEGLMAAAVSLAKQVGVDHVEFRDTLARPLSWPVRTDKVTMQLTLPQSPDDLWKLLGSKLRAQIKRPQREQIQTTIGHSELIDDFYAVFARNMRDLGTPVYSKYFFVRILESFPDTARIVILRLENKPVAVGFLLGFRDRLEIPWASSLRSSNSIGANMLLYWEVLKYAIESGYRTFDFGRSTRESGTYRFKKQWGALPMQLYWHYWHPEGKQLPVLNPTNPKYKLAIRVWKHLPIFLTNLIGPSIVKNLP